VCLCLCVHRDILLNATLDHTVISRSGQVSSGLGFHSNEQKVWLRLGYDNKVISCKICASSFCYVKYLKVVLSWPRFKTVHLSRGKYKSITDKD
jgi:hypothetical protein